MRDIAESGHTAASIFEGLNPEQIRAVQHGTGPAVVAAVAGCGKTRVIVLRMKLLIEGGAEEERVLAVTFSVKAAKEMNDRLVSLGVARARVGTFHSLSWQIVRAERPDLARWQLDDRDRYRNIVKEALGFRHLDWKQADLTVVLSYIGRCKASAALPGTDEAMQLAQRLHRALPCTQRDPSLLATAYFTAEEIRRDRQLLTFDDQLLEAWTLLTTDEACRARWAARWDYVLQDEAQDENAVQRQIASALARDHRNYMIVGDPSQSIFGFRGSDPSGMLRFPAEWGGEMIGMVRNYRSGRRIIEVANRAIDAMPADSHLGTKIVAERELDGQVTTTRYADFDQEGAGVVERILEACADGRRWGDCAVLYRTNAQSRGVEEALLSARVPYVVAGGTNFYDRKEVKDLLAYLRIAEGRADFDDVRRAINTPFRFLGKAFLEGLESASRAHSGTVPWTTIVRSYIDSGRAGLQQRQRTSALSWCALIDDIAALLKRAADKQSATADDVLEARPARVLEGVVVDVDYTAWLTRDEGTESPENNRVSNVRELIRAAERFPTAAELLDYVDETLDKAAAAKRDGGSADCVTLMSIHRSKGLEWPVVHLIGVNGKVLPHARAEDLAEERRLFYVGVTRARDELHISCVSRAAVGARVVQLEPSRFLAECDLHADDFGSVRDVEAADEQI